jgi:hypothetical protein
MRFTKQNASEFGRKGGMAEKSRRTALAAIPIESDDNRRKQRVLRQIDRLDVMIESTRDPELFLRLASSKERLWNLVYPKPGSLRPKQSRQDRAPIAPIQPLPIDTLPAVVVSEIEQTHKSENVKS